MLVFASCCCAQTSITGAWSYSGNLTFTGASAPSVLNPDNLYCASGTPTWLASDGPATLPLVCYNTLMANTPAPGAVVNVTANSATDLQAKLTAAVCGQRITLPAGSVYTGHFTLPLLHCTAGNYLWIVTAGLASLPAEVAAYTTTYNGITLYLPQFGPCYAGVSSLLGRPTMNCPGIPGTYTAKIVTPDAQPPVKFTGGTSSIRLIGLELTRTAGTGFVSELLNLGSIANVDHLIFDRVWCHGDENQDETEACFYTTAASYVASVDSYYNNFYCISSIGTCSDAKAIGGAANTLNSTVEIGLKLVNNFFEASGENILYGGGGSNTVAADFEIRLNTNFKPLTWNPSDPAYNGGISGHAFIVKNLFEFKNGRRVLIEGNTFVNNWAQAQNGTALLFTPKNGTNNCPLCADLDVTFRYNRVNTAGSVAQLVMAKSDLGYFAAGGNRYSFHDNVADNLNYATCNCTTGIQTFLMWSDYATPSSSQVEHDVSVNHNTAVYASTSGNPTAAIGLSGPLISTGHNMFNMTFINNVVLSGSTGTSNTIGGGIAANCAEGTTGAAEINACWTTYTLGGNCFINNGSVSWPGSNVTSLANQAAAYVSWNNGNAGNYTLSANACQAHGLDGTDPGANISALASVLAGNAAPANLPLIALTNMDDFGLGTPGWQSACVGPGCAGGVGTPSSWNQTFTNASPSLDGNSMMMTETGTNFSNVMFHDSIGADNAATTFTGSYRVYIPDLTPYQVFGMDMYQFIPGFRLMFGSQCAVAGSTAGFWSFFDQQPAPNGTWYVTTVPCPLTSAAWHAISMTVHRVPGDTSCPGGGPAVHYDSLTQDGTTYALNIAHCSETYGGANDTGMQFDVSSNAVGGTLTAYVDLMNYTATF